MDIDDLHEIADDVAEALDKHMDDIGAFVINCSKSKYPYSYFALTSFIPKVESIRIALFEIVEMDEVYSEKILYRSVIEHFLKSQYILMRLMQEKTDEVGKDYLFYCDSKEKIDIAKSLKMRAEILGLQLNINPLDILKELNHEAQNKSHKYIKSKAGLFTPKSIIRYINDALSKGLESPAPFIADIMPAYSELSSFVHGGPHTLLFSEICSNPNIASDELRKDATLSLQMSLSVRAFAFLMFAQEDKTMFKPFSIVSNAIKTKFKNDKHII